MSDEVIIQSSESVESKAQESNEQPKDSQPKDQKDPKAQKSEEKPQPKLRKVKVNGKEEVVDEDEIFRDYQKYRAANELFQEASMSKKQVSEFMRALQEDPEQVLNNPKLGIKKRDLAEKWLREELEREMADPRDLRMKELEEENTKYKSKETQEQEAKQKEEDDRQVAAQREQISKDLEAAMEATVLKKDESTLREMAYYMRVCAEQGIEATPEQIARHVEGRKLNNFIQVAQRLDGDQLLEFLGDEVTNRIRKADLSRLRGSNKPMDEIKPEPMPVQRQKEAPKMNRWEAAEMARKKLGLD